METKTLTLCMAMLVIMNFRCIRCINLGYISPIGKQSFRFSFVQIIFKQKYTPKPTQPAFTQTYIPSTTTTNNKRNPTNLYIPDYLRVEQKKKRIEKMLPLCLNFPENKGKKPHSVRNTSNEIFGCLKCAKAQVIIKRL